MVALLFLDEIERMPMSMQISFMCECWKSGPLETIGLLQPNRS